MIQNETQARIILNLIKVPVQKRTLTFLSFKTGINYQTLALNTNILAAGELIKKGKQGRNVYYNPTPKAVVHAKDYLRLPVTEDERKAVETGVDSIEQMKVEELLEGEEEDEKLET